MGALRSEIPRGPRTPKSELVQAMAEKIKMINERVFLGCVDVVVEFLLAGFEGF